MRNSFYAVLLLAAAAACGRGDRATPENDTASALGTCTQEEPGTPPVDGNALYAVDRTATAGGAAEGRFAAMITCTTPGPGGSAVALILPNLTDSLPRPGRYRIHAPGVLPARDSLARLGWAEALVPATHGLTYRGMGGELVIERVEDGEGTVTTHDRLGDAAQLDHRVRVSPVSRAPARAPARPRARGCGSRRRWDGCRPAG